MSIQILKNQTLFDVILDKEHDKITFITMTGDAYVMMHHQDCCEDVYIESIVGDLRDLIGEPILLAEEISNENETPNGFPKISAESYTWTFYKLATKKGYVDIRFFGSSNGYYSESVCVAKDNDLTKEYEFVRERMILKSKLEKKIKISEELKEKLNKI